MQDTRIAEKDFKPSLRLLAGSFSGAVISFYDIWTSVSVSRGTIDLLERRRETSFSEDAKTLQVA